MNALLPVALCLALGLFQGCSCSDNAAKGGAGDGGGDLSGAMNGDDGSSALDDLAGFVEDLPRSACTVPTSLAVTPATTTATVKPGMPYTLSFTVTASYSGGPDVDVTTDSFLGSSDPTIGTISGGTFTWGGNHGGTVVITAHHCGQVTTAMLSLIMSATVPTGTVDPTMAMTQFGGPATGTANCNPTLVYPPDGVLIPPNTNVIEVHFLLGSPANNLFEISFSNAVTDVKVYTACTGATPADGKPLNGGCVFELNQAEWDYIARTNADRAPLTVRVRGVGCDGNNVGASSTRDISFAKEDLVGALYYWSSINVGGANPYSGGVFRYDFGVRGQTATPILTPTNLPAVNPGFCIGCHDISRDGRQMVFDYDDNDGDDEYGDVSTDIFDIVKKTTAVQHPLVKGGSFPPGFHTWNRETTEFLLSDGPGGTATQLNAFRRVNPLGVTQGYTKPGTLRGTTPDWAPDDSVVVFAVPPNIKTTPPTAGFWQKHDGTADDLWFAGASLYTAPWNAMTKTLGAPTALVTATGTQNYYYPSFSPDGSLIAFNYAPDGPNFHNPKARVRVVAAGQANPVPLDLAKANQADGLTNSWARWSPFVQTYQGQKLLWMTFSSTRNYGLRIVNDGLTNCYPTESPTGFRAFTGTPNPACSKTQLWMAAVRLDATMVMAGTDVSWPAFWLPFQDIDHNNHLAQWAQRSYTGKCTQASDCGAGQCCDNGGCTTCTTPPPPPADCTSAPNCDPDQCCRGGLCGSCAGGGGPTGCNTCLDCPGQACVGGACGACTDTSQCCAPNVCDNGACVYIIP